MKSARIFLVILLFAVPLLAQDAPAFKEDELAALLAPVALYPDTVIAQILMASTYPMEIVEAHRWVEANKSLKGDALATEVQKQAWDPSVQALAALPDVLKMMNEKLDWTQKVGDAFLGQQKEVLDMVQKLRNDAMEAGNLKSDEKMKVTTTPAAAESSEPQVIVIESSDPETVYVPTYSPTTVYGSWGYPSYPPYYWPPPIGYPGSGFWWGMGVGIAVGGIWGGGWDNDVDWNGGDINIGEINIGGGDRERNVDRSRERNTDRSRDGNRTSGGNKWSHDPQHRKGASYRDNKTASKFNKGSQGAGASSRDSYRGRSGSGTGASAGTSNRASTGTSNRATAGTSNVGSGSSSRGTSGTNLGSTPSTRSGTSSSSGRVSSTGSSSSRSSSGSSYGGRSSSSSGSAFGGSSSGSRASSYGSRGSASRGGGGGMRGGGGRRR